MHLRSYVSQEDVDMAIRVLLDSFISTQKFGVQKALQKVNFANVLLDSYYIVQRYNIQYMYLIIHLKSCQFGQRIMLM